MGRGKLRTLPAWMTAASNAPKQLPTLADLKGPPTRPSPPPRNSYPDAAKLQPQSQRIGAQRRPDSPPRKSSSRRSPSSSPPRRRRSRSSSRSSSSSSSPSQSRRKQSRRRSRSPRKASRSPRRRSRHSPSPRKASRSPRRSRSPRSYRTRSPTRKSRSPQKSHTRSPVRRSPGRPRSRTSLSPAPQQAPPRSPRRSPRRSSPRHSSPRRTSPKSQSSAPAKPKTHSPTSSPSPERKRKRSASSSSDDSTSSSASKGSSHSSHSSSSSDHKHKHRSSKSKKHKKSKSKKHKKRHSKSPERNLPEGASSLGHDRDSEYLQKHTEFKVWLFESEHKYFDKLSKSRAKKYFKKFIKKWNKGKLDIKFYKGIHSTQLEGALKSSHKWNFKMSGADKMNLDLTRDAVDTKTHHMTREALLERSGDADPRTVSQIKPGKDGKDDKHKHPRDKPHDRADKQWREAVVEEMLGPKPTGRDAMMEKKAVQREKARERDVSPDTHVDLMGDSGNDFHRRCVQGIGSPTQHAHQRVAEPIESSRLSAGAFW
eukprot:c12048_g1_i3.p1 GENE.c12048_g1_i3~~c12048_g1_i3.p1  ORF type:complete len:566 (-),score=105.06 c12048_g1_i3:454-2073(-)